MDRAPDDGAMSIRLDPRRVSTLKQLAADAGMRPGDLVRQWVEERLDAARGGAAAPASGPSADLAERVAELAARVHALEMAGGGAQAGAAAEPESEPDGESTAGDEVATPLEPDLEAAAAGGAARRRRARGNTVTAAPSAGRVALHDEMTEVLRERGPMTAAELAGAIAERGRYAPPRSGKPLDAAMVSQRVSNPTYRSRFVRQDGRIGLAE